MLFVDGIDRMQCCASNGVTGQCLGVCSGNTANLPVNLNDCWKHIFTFAACYDIPPPTRLPPTPGEFSDYGRHYMPYVRHRFYIW